MGGEISVDFGPLTPKLGGKSRVFGFLPGARARPGVLVGVRGVMGEDIEFAAFRRRASFARESLSSLGVRTSMGWLFPGLVVTLAWSGVIYGLARALGNPAVRGLDFFPLLGVRNVDIDCVNTAADCVRVDHVGSEGLRC